MGGSVSKRPPESVVAYGMLPRLPSRGATCLSPGGAHHPPFANLAFLAALALAARHRYSACLAPPMLRNRPQRVFWAVALGDLLALALAFQIAAFVHPEAVRTQLLVGLPVSYAVLGIVGRIHASVRAVEPWALVGRAVVFWVQVVMGLALFQLLVEMPISRTTTLAICFLFLPCMILGRAVVLFMCKLLQKEGRSQRHVVIAGTGETARITAAAIETHPGWGIRLLGFLRTRDDANEDPPTAGMNVLGHFSHLPRLVQDLVVDEIVVADPGATLESVEEITRSSETIGLRAYVVADFCQTQTTTVDRTDLAGRTLLVLTPFPDQIFGGAFKRAIDLAGSAVGMLLLSPVLFAVAILVKLTSPGPALYAQTRLGRNGRPFKFYKFRTMVNGADAMKNGLMARNEMDGPVFKIKDDPRVTKVGRILRRYSIDELPQLWNVFVGSMSLVGPRPPVPEEVANYETWQRRRLSMKPGLTCLWQINGRNNTDFETWMRQDLSYIDNWSIGSDMKILFKTLPVVLTGRGAS